NGVDTLRIAGRLGFSDGVPPRSQMGELVTPAAVGRGSHVNSAAEIVGPLQPDCHSTDAVFAKVDLAIVVEILEHETQQAAVLNRGEGQHHVIAIAANIADREAVGAGPNGCT